MNDFVKYLIFLQFSVQFFSVASYTVVLKQVKTLHPSVKVYRYELRPPKLLPESNTQYIYHKPLLGQRIYPVKHGRDGSFKPRPPPKKFLKGGERPPTRDARLLGLSPSQHLVPPVSNQLEEHSEAKEEEEVRPLVIHPNLGKSFSSFGQDKGRVYNHSGEWATPAPQADAENTTKAEFTPSQLYLQIRHKNTVIHVPQSEALKDAETLEELINAPRLKELARTTHVQETYSEEGYEDAGYDHAGHIRQAQHGEVYDAKDEGRFKIKDPPVIIDYDTDLEESKKVPSKNSIENVKEPLGENLSNKLEPRITRSRSEVGKTSADFAKTPKNYKGDHKYSSRVKGPLRSFDENGKWYNATDAKGIFPNYFGELSPTPTSFLLNETAQHYKPPNKKSSKYRKDELGSTKIFPVTESNPSDVPQVNNYTDFKPYISLIDAQASPSTKSLKYSKIYSKKTKQLRLQPFKSENIFSPPPPPSAETEPPPHEHLQPPSADEKVTGEELTNQRIVLPTIGYINSLTTAYFGKDSPKSSQEESKTEITDPLNLTQALNYLRSKKPPNGRKQSESTVSPSEVDIRTFEPMKLKKTRPPPQTTISKSKRDVYLVKSRDRRSEKETEKYEGNDESDAPHNEKNEEISEDERKRIEEENLEKEKYEANLREEISNQEKEILKETYKNIGVEEDISEVFPRLPSSDSEPDFSSQPEETTPTPVDVRKYPFYLSKRLPENSALRYATDPKQFPKKSGHKMEFYESREGVIQCPDFHPDLGDLPNSDSSGDSEERPGESQRLLGLGDKIACLRMKYFDPEPFDNPIFKEREIDYVGKRRHQKRLRTKILPKSFKKENEKSEQSPPRKSPEKIGHQRPAFKTRNHISSQESRNVHIVPSEKNRTETPEIIPVTETLHDVPPSPVAVFSNPLIGWKTIYHSPQSPQTYSRLTKSPTSLRHTKPPLKRLTIPHKCLHSIGKLTFLDGTKNLTVDCSDATVVQEVVENVARLRIIPKEEKKHSKRKWSDSFSTKSSDESDWIPIAGPSGHKLFGRFRAPVSRRTDEVTKLKNETENVSPNHYVIDGLKEEENVRKGEVVDDIDHYMTLMSDFKDGEKIESTTAKNESETEPPKRRERRDAGDSAKEPKTTEAVGSAAISKKFQTKRPLKRLSGIDFLVRYHKNKGKHTTEKTEDFWKVSNTQKPHRHHTTTEKLSRATKDGNTTPLHGTTEASTRKTEISQLTSWPSGPPKTKKQTEPRKISPLNLIPERITKRPEVRASEFRRSTTAPLEIPKIVTKVSIEMSHSTTSSRSSQTPKAEPLQRGHPGKSEVPQYKTVTRNGNASESKQSIDYSEGAVLYYVVNLKTGRGKWITDYEERTKGNSGKALQSHNPKEQFGTKRDKRRKKQKY